MTRVIRIKGMSCHHCIKHIEEAINEIKGATCLEVSLEKETATIDCENDEIMKDIIKSIKDLGYEVISYE